MDLEKLGDYEFLDLSDIDENEKQQLKQTLFSQDSDFLQLPWSNDLNADKWQKEAYASEATSLQNGPIAEVLSTVQHGAPLAIETSEEPHTNQSHAQQQMQPVTIYSPMPTYSMPPPSTEYQHQSVFVTNVTANQQIPHTISHYNVPHYNPEPVDPVGRGHRGRGRPRPKRNENVMENTQFAPPYVPMYNVHYPTYYPQPMGSPLQHPNQHAPASPLYIAYATPVYGAYPPYYSPQNTHVGNVMEDAPEMHEMNMNTQENHVYQPNPINEDYNTETQNCPVVNNLDSKTPYVNNNNIEVDKLQINNDSVINNFIINSDINSSEKNSVDTILTPETNNADNSFVNNLKTQKINSENHENTTLSASTIEQPLLMETTHQSGVEKVSNVNQQVVTSFEQVLSFDGHVTSLEQNLNTPNLAPISNIAAPVSNMATTMASNFNLASEKELSTSNLENSTFNSNNQELASNNCDSVFFHQTDNKATEKVEVNSSKSPIQNSVSPNLTNENLSQKNSTLDSISNNNKMVENNVEQNVVSSSKPSWASLFSNKSVKNVQETVVNDAVKNTVNKNNNEPVNEVKERKLVNQVERKNVSNQKSAYKNDPASHRMGEFLSKYTLDNRAVSLQPRGLTNRSNYCYINSILQALLACPPFYNLLKALPYQYRKNLLSKSPTPIIDSMVEFVNEFMPLPAGARLNRKEKGQRKDDPIDVPCGSSFEPSWIYKILNGIRSDTFIVEGRQEDAEEFFGCLLNGLNDEMLELMKLVDGGNQNNNKNLSNGDVNANREQTEDEWKVMGPKNKGSITRRAEFERSPISDIFRGQLRSRVHRTNSRAQDQVTDNVQPFFTLQLDIEKHNSVLEALEALVMKDKLEGVTCSKTKQQVEAWQQVTVEELPLVLVLHLKCFNYKLDVCSKIIKALEFPIELKIDSKLLSTKTKYSGKQKQYKLFAVVYHDGKEASKGHYLTDAFHVGYGGWIRYDDSSVKSVNESQVLHPTAARVPYLLYYRRCDTIGINQQTNTINNKKD